MNYTANQRYSDVESCEIGIFALFGSNNSSVRYL